MTKVTGHYNSPVADSNFSYRALLRDSVRLYGVAGTVRRLARGFSEFLRDLLPSRRRLRYGDLDFDFDEKMDTTWSNVSLRTRFREIFSERGYQATDPVIFAEMMGQVDADLSSFVFVDLGCGKGRALLLAHKFGFRRFVGVELLPELLESARRNIAKLPAEERAAFELLATDARRYEFPAEPIFLYLFDPFPPAVLAEVLAHLIDSVNEHPRRVLIGYQNPVSDSVFAATPGIRKVAATQQWALYRLTY